jgi:heavy metal translocating P-type ATPase
MSWSRRLWLLAAPATGLVLGLFLQWTGSAGAARWVWIAGTLPVLASLLRDILASLRRGALGLDIVAALAMIAAIAAGESLAATVVAIMVAGGASLEAFAARRAGREMTALLARVPRTALRHRDHQLEEIALDAVMPGDRLLVRRGEVVPVDGTVASPLAVLDLAALTGESQPVQAAAGEPALSGASNAGEAFDLVASRRAADSTFAGIVRLVETAQQARAPMARLADRFALVFLAVTVLMAGLAALLTGDPVRAVAVLVIATPCPLILAVPVALVAGLSRAARAGILVKGGGALETLARVRSLVLDKTGTLTEGRAAVIAIDPVAPWTETELLRLAAALNQASQHVTARQLVAEAQHRGLALPVPAALQDTPGEGIEGVVEGRSVAVGSRGFVQGRLGASLPAATQRPGAITAAVAIDGRFAGAIVLADHLRQGTAELLGALRDLGIGRIVLATGDRRDVALALTQDLGLDDLRHDLSPDQKVLVVLSERKFGPVMMVGDGVNDAPALAAADLGVAMGARGSAASAQAADIVILVDRLDRLVPAIRIARRARAIALQSVVAGLGLSLAGMAAAATGWLTPVQGAVLQEVIDVAVILNALRALGGRIGSADAVTLRPAAAGRADPGPAPAPAPR